MFGETTLLSATHIAELLNAPAPPADFPAARGMAFNSSRVRPGDVFFALPGATTHGMRFADDALTKGAAFVVSDRPHDRGLQVSDPAAALLALGRWARANLTGPVIGITGSVGKTTTKAFLAAALGAPSSPGNFNTPLALATTLFNTYLEMGAETPLVLELGIDHIGEMAQLVDVVNPTHGLLTAVAASHLEGLGSLETVAAEKSKLLSAAQHRWASVQAAGFLSPTLRASVTTYGLEPDADRTGRVVANRPAGQRVEYRGVVFDLNYPGEAVARNAVGALVVAEALGFSVEEATARLEGVRLEPGRLLPVTRGAARLLDDTYNSNPASAAEALAVLRAAPGPRTAILGDMLELGADSETLHEELGRQTLGLDRVLAIGPEAAALGAGNPQVEVFASFGEALPVLAALRLEGTLLVKASRGMHFERVVEALHKLASQKQRVPA
ncbi:UDP-N-acetylmuramoyl-tripeptide--D-alanyl-D-alanine ligase [soil metagenome]